MNDYISRQAALFIIAEYDANKYGENKRLWDLVYEIPAADVRPVITCQKCKYGRFNGIEYYCDLHSGNEDSFDEDKYYKEFHSKHWFCADGEVM